MLSFIPERLKRYLGPGNSRENVKGQGFYGRGKLLLSGEYAILHGARGLALPTFPGQRLRVTQRPSFSPRLEWKAFDADGNLWFSATFELWHFKLIEGEETEQTAILQKVLTAVRKQNSHFLRDENHYLAETFLEFPRDWGLGSSSTLIYNIAQWAYVSPFHLLFETQGGSGYDVACAQSNGPLIYNYGPSGPSWETTNFSPVFSNQLYFVYLGQKAQTSTEIEKFASRGPVDQDSIHRISLITMAMREEKSLVGFQQLMREHESLVGKLIGRNPIKAERFSDFPGEIKSLGAWGGDFALVATDLKALEVKNYFLNHGLEILIPFDKLVLTTPVARVH